MRLLLQISVLALIAVSGSAGASAMTFSRWQQSSETYQEAYVWGIVEALITFADSDEELKTAKAYEKCFKDNQVNSGTTLKMVQDHLARTPDAATTPMAINVVRTFVGACKRYLDSQ